MTVWKITSKEIVSNIFNALDDDNYIWKKNNICHILYILWRTDNYVYKKQTTILFLSRGYFCFSVNSKIIYFTIVSLFTGRISSLWTKKKSTKKETTVFCLSMLCF